MAMRAIETLDAREVFGQRVGIVGRGNRVRSDPAAQFGFRTRRVAANVNRGNDLMSGR